MNLKTIKKLIDASSKKALQTSAKKAKDIEVLPALTKKDKKIVEEIIEEADTLSPKLKDVDLPKYEPFSKLEKQKALLATIPVGAGAAVAYNQLNKDIPSLPEQQASSIDNSIKDEEEGPLAANRSIMAALTPKDTNIEAPSKTQEKLQQKVSAASTLPIGSTEQSKPEEEPDLQNIDFGDNSIAKLQALRDALSRSRDAVFANSAARLGAATAAQMSGTKNQFDEAIAGQIEQAKSIPDDYLKEVQFEKEDPNSAMSKGYRDIAKSLGFNVIGSASASDLERIIPQMSNIYNQKQAQQARAEQAELDREARAEQRAMQMAMMSQSKQSARELKDEQLKNKFIENAQKVTAKEFEKLQKVENAFNSIEMAEKDKMGPADVTILYNFIKSQDPESVVREGEIALGQRGMSLAGRLRTATIGQFTGELLDPKFRKDVLKIARRLKDQGYNTYDQSVATIRDTAKQRYGFTDDELTLIDPDLNRKKKAEQAPKQAPAVKTLKPEDVDALTDAEVEAALKMRGL